MEEKILKSYRIKILWDVILNHFLRYFLNQKKRGQKMKKLNELKVGQYVPVSFVVNGTLFDVAFPIPFLKVTISNSDGFMQISEVDKSIKSAIPSNLVKNCKTNIPFKDIKRIEFDAIKHFNGGFKEVLNLRYFCTFHITLLNGDVYSFLNSSMLLILEVYDALKTLDIKFIDEHNLIHILSKIPTNINADEKEKEIVNGLNPIAKELNFLYEKR